MEEQKSELIPVRRLSRAGQLGHSSGFQSRLNGHGQGGTEKKSGESRASKKADTTRENIR